MRLFHVSILVAIVHGLLNPLRGYGFGVHKLGFTKDGAASSSSETEKPLKPAANGPVVPKNAPDSFARDLSLMGANVIDTVEDVAVHFKRYLAPGGVRGLLEKAQDALVDETSEGGVIKRGKKKRVVVVGSGWSAHALVKIIDTDLYEVLVLSPRPFFIFTPMLTGASVGTIEIRSIIEPIRSANPLVDYVEAEVVDVNPSAQSVLARPKQDPSRNLAIEYDYLVYAAGCAVNDFGMKSVREHCFFVKEIEDVQNIRRRILDNFERASIPSTSEKDIARLLTFAVVGGGPTGVEFCGELEDFVTAEVKKNFPRLLSRVKVVLINSGSSLLNAFDSDLQDLALKALRRSGVDVVLNARVTKIESTSLVYSAAKGGGETVIPFGLCVWAAGTGPRDITKVFADRLGIAAEDLKQEGGRLRCDKWCRVLGGPNTEVHQQDVDAVVESERTVGEWDAEWETKKTSRGGAKLGSIFSMGDCASLLGNADGALPQTAQVAAQQGAYVARLLNRGYDLSKPGGPELDKSVFTEDPLRATSLFFRGIASAPGFTFLNLGLLAYVGSSEAVAQVELGVDVRASGRPAFLLWRSVYLVKQVSTRTRFLVLFDWIKSRVFGRDISGM